MNGGHLGTWRQVVGVRLAENQKERVCSANALFLGIVDPHILIAPVAQFLYALLGLFLQLLEFAKVNGLRRAGFCAGRNHPRQLAVVAKRTLEGQPFLLALINDTKRTGDHTVPAAVADVGLHIDRAYLCAHNRARRTGFQTARVSAMFADVGHEDPAERFLGACKLWSQGLLLLEKRDMSPGGGAQVAGVVVGEGAPVQPTLGELISLPSRYLTHLTTDAYRRIGEESGRFHTLPSACAEPCSSAPLRSSRRPGKTLQRIPFVSIMRTFGSSEMATRSLTTSPFTS